MVAPFKASCVPSCIWLVYEPYYEAGKDTTGTLVTTDYNTKLENTMSYGPYKLVSLQNDKQMVFEKNENWYGYTEENVRLVSTTPYLVDGENVPRYVTDKIVINVMDDNAAKQAFLTAAWGQTALHPTLPHSVGRAFARNSFTPPCRGRACPARSLAITTPFILCIVGRQATGPLHNRPAPSNTKITCLRSLAGRLFF